MEKSGTTNYRTEFALLPYGRDTMTSHGSGQFSMPFDFWYGFRWRCTRFDAAPSGYDYVGAHLAQWHDNESPVYDRNPPLSLWITENGVRVYHEANDDAGGGNVYSSYIVAAPFVGTSYDFMLRIRWDTRTNAQGGSGAVDLYLNETTTPVYQWRGQTCHPSPDTLGPAPYFKFGMYSGYYRGPGWPSAMEGRVFDQIYDHVTLMGADGSRLGVKPPGAR
jgi:hypothetical protein